ncbi:MAG: hypothetical protein GYB65_20240 [Chloroflexi bacterium]|nr:hypothetical protein [Chloroflexota bacterium]
MINPLTRAGGLVVMGLVIVLVIALMTGCASSQPAASAQPSRQDPGPTVYYDRNGSPLDDGSPFVEYASRELTGLLVNDVLVPSGEIEQGGFRVYTTLDINYQTLAEAAARQEISAQVGSNVSDAAVVILNPSTGEILAMVGSIDASSPNNSTNIAADGLRQPGGALKPFVYAAALEQGWTAASIIWDTPVDILLPDGSTFQPANFDSTYHGPVSVRQALANDYNIPAVQTLRATGAYDPDPTDRNTVIDAYDLVGISPEQGPQNLLLYDDLLALDYLVGLMNRTGVTSLSTDSLAAYDISLPVGGGMVTPLELTGAYGVLANGGVYVPPTPFRCVTTAQGDILYEYAGGCPMEGTTPSARTVSVTLPGQPVLDPRIAFIISNILADEQARQPAFGATSPLDIPGLPTAVKTGSTIDASDAWTVGYTRNVVVGVWAGNADNTPTVPGADLTVAAPIWNTVLTGIYTNAALLDSLGDRPADDAHLQAPGGVSAQLICDVSRANLREGMTSCTPTLTEWFLNSPALVPDSTGELVPTTQSPVTDLPETGPQPQIIGPGVVRVEVVPLEAEVVAQLTTTFALPVEPRYCQVPVELRAEAPDAQPLLFLVPPPLAADAANARAWARASGVAIVPEYTCTAEMLQDQPDQVVVANITFPPSSAEIPASAQIDVTGSVIFTPEQAQFYKLEIQGGPFEQFVTLGDIEDNRTAVTNGVLTTIQAYGLPPGEYTLQLVVIGPDSNWLQDPYVVRFTVIEG